MTVLKKLYDREMLVSILTNRIGHTMAVGPDSERLVFVDSESVDQARVIAEALIDKELADRSVLKSLLGLLPQDELNAEIRESLEELLGIIGKT